MNSTVVTAMAAALGSLVGAAASIATTWITQRTQTIRAHSEWKLRVRESLYNEFIRRRVSSGPSASLGPNSARLLAPARARWRATVDTSSPSRDRHVLSNLQVLVSLYLTR